MTLQQQTDLREKRKNTISPDNQSDTSINTFVFSKNEKNLNFDKH